MTLIVASDGTNAHALSATIIAAPIVRPAASFWQDKFDFHE
jgi:hypothetical protein